MEKKRLLKKTWVIFIIIFSLVIMSSYETDANGKNIKKSIKVFFKILLKRGKQMKKLLEIFEKDKEYNNKEQEEREFLKAIEELKKLTIDDVVEQYIEVLNEAKGGLDKASQIDKAKRTGQIIKKVDSLRNKGEIAFISGCPITWEIGMIYNVFNYEDFRHNEDFLNLGTIFANINHDYKIVISPNLSMQFGHTNSKFVNCFFYKSGKQFLFIPRKYSNSIPFHLIEKIKKNPSALYFENDKDMSNGIHALKTNNLVLISNSHIYFPKKNQETSQVNENQFYPLLAFELKGIKEPDIENFLNLVRALEETSNRNRSPLLKDDFMKYFIYVFNELQRKKNKTHIIWQDCSDKKTINKIPPHKFQKNN